jgi:hypothetical protein
MRHEKYENSPRIHCRAQEFQLCCWHGEVNSHSHKTSAIHSIQVPQSAPSLPPYLPIFHALLMFLPFSSVCIILYHLRPHPKYLRISQDVPGLWMLARCRVEEPPVLNASKPSQKEHFKKAKTSTAHSGNMWKQTKALLAFGYILWLAEPNPAQSILLLIDSWSGL